MEAFRVTPAGPASAYDTYRIVSPQDTLVVAACEQVGCEWWAKGWVSEFDERTELGAAQARYVRFESGRTFRERRTAGGLTVFEFEAHQRCFAEHQTRPERYAVQHGDFRQTFGPPRVHVRAADWVEDMAGNLDRLAEIHKQG